MEISTVSMKYQITLPEGIVNEFGIYPGQKLYFYRNENGLQIIPEIQLNELFGKMKIEDKEIIREDDRL